MYKQSLLSAASTQAYGYLVTTSDEPTGTRWFAALFKAKDEILANGTIRFDRHNRVLRFVSRYSGKRRIVTSAGCSTECDCKGLPSYHFAVWQILSRYYDLLGEEPTEQPFNPQRFNQGKTEKVGNYRI